MDTKANIKAEPEEVPDEVKQELSGSETFVLEEDISELAAMESLNLTSTQIKSHPKNPIKKMAEQEARFLAGFRQTVARFQELLAIENDALTTTGQELERARRDLRVHMERTTAFERDVDLIIQRREAISARIRQLQEGLATFYARIDQLIEGSADLLQPQNQ